MSARLFLTEEEVQVLLHEMGIQDAPEDFVYSDDHKKWDYHRGSLYAKLKVFRRGGKSKTAKDADKQRIWDAIKDASKP